MEVGYSMKNPPKRRVPRPLKLQNRGRSKIYDVTKRWRYSDVGCFGRATYCSGTFYHVRYRYVRFRVVELYAAVPLWQFNIIVPILYSSSWHWMSFFPRSSDGPNTFLCYKNYLETHNNEPTCRDLYFYFWLQENQHPDTKASNGRGNLVRRASSASRLSLLFRKVRQVIPLLP